jgi:hypothetical protein
MRLIISRDNGEVVKIIDHLEEYNLEKPVTRAELIEEIEEAVEEE